MRAALVRLFGAYVLLNALLAAEFFAAFLPLQGQARLLLVLPALVMAWVVAAVFMGLRREGGPVLMFAAAAALWMAILLGLGILDPVTRAMFSTAHDAGLSSPDRD
jgi:cytochrome c oxidase subunit IV